MSPTGKKGEDGLTPKRRRFILEYLKDSNASRAAIAAGYSPDSANQLGYTLLATPVVAEAIRAAQDARAKRLEITADRVVQAIAQVAFGDPRSIMSWSPNGVKVRDSNSLTQDEAALVAEVTETRTREGVTVRVHLNDKLSALDKLCRYLGLFVDRSELTGKDGGAIRIEEATREDLQRRIAGLAAAAAAGAVPPKPER